MAENNLDVRVSIDEMRHVLTRTHVGLETARVTARSVLSAASLVVALLGVLQLTNMRIVDGYTLLFDIGLLAAMGLYVAQIAFCLYVLWPAKMYAPIDSNWDEISAAFFGKEERDILKKQLSGILNAIELSEKTVARRWKASAVASGLLPVVVVLLLLLGTVPRV